MQMLKTKDDFIDAIIMKFSDTDTAVSIIKEIDKMKTYEINNNRIETIHKTNKNMNISNSVELDLDKSRIILSKHKNKNDYTSSYQNDFQLTYLVEGDNETIHKGYTTINETSVNNKKVKTIENCSSYCNLENGKFCSAVKEKETTTIENNNQKKEREIYAEIVLATGEYLNIKNKNGKYEYLLKVLDDYGTKTIVPISEHLANILKDLKDDPFQIINNEEYYNLKNNKKTSL